MHGPLRSRRSGAVAVQRTSWLLGLCLACGSSTPPAESSSDAQAPTDALAPTDTPPRLTTLDLLAGQPGGRGWVDGTLVAAHFQEPWEITGDGDHTLYVADSNIVRTIDQTTSTVSTLAGSYGHPGSSDGVGTAATFSLPSGFAYASGILYLSDTENFTIRQIDVVSGAVTTLAGQVGVRGDTDGPASQALFGEPEGIALDPSGKLYISDTDNNLIRVLDLSTGMVSTVAGSGPSVSTLTDGIATAAAFNKPKAMRIDGAGDLYVADAFNQAVRKVVPSTGAVTTLAKFASVPQGLAIDGDDVLVSLSAGQGGENDIMRVSPDGTVAAVAGSATASGFVDGAGTAALFDSPAGLYEDGSGDLLVADSANFALREVTIADANVVTYAGAQSIGTSDGTGRQARFSGPLGLATDNTTTYVADTGNDTIRAIAIATGTVTTLAGAAGQPGHVDGSLLDARFDAPQGLALDAASHMLYVGDMLNRVVRRIDLGKGVVSTLSYANGPGFVGLDGPSGLAHYGVDLFVADSNDDDIVAVDLQKGEISRVAGQFDMPGTEDGEGADAGFYGPTGAAADGLGNLYVADSQASTVRKIVLSSATVSTIAGSPNMPGYRDGVGTLAYLTSPFGVTVNDLGDLFVADTGNNVVRHVDLSSGTVTTVIGSPDLPGVKLGTLPAQITLPSAIALTPGGSLLVVSENSVLIAH
jgi:WD40 repeat protein